uniref:Uncharacterized protein n=1 Tax=Branchiostoma floridae TaxID=7739 RepID=C3ZX10_BRAFL|eukprot:XP_002586914.1 hypothetical protein BRAFLDRAFT_105136 [Branchiostoma floridae]
MASNESDVREHSVATVPCYPLIQDIRYVSYINVSTIRQANDTTCQPAASTIDKNVAPMNTAPAVSHEKKKNVTSTNVPPSVTPYIVAASTFWMPLIGSPLIKSLQGFDATYSQINDGEVYDASGHDYSEIKDDNLAFPSSAASALRRNQMYSGNAQGAPITKSLQGPDTTYNQINEDEVYAASGHDYSETKEEDISTSEVRDNTYSQINEDEVYAASGHDYSETKEEDISTSEVRDNTYSQINEDEVYAASGHDYNGINDQDTSVEHVLDTSERGGNM